MKTKDNLEVGDVVVIAYGGGYEKAQILAVSGEAYWVKLIALGTETAIDKNDIGRWSRFILLKDSRVVFAMPGQPKILQFKWLKNLLCKLP